MDSSMKSLYESILSSTNAGKASIIKAWLDENGIKNYTINSKGEVDVDGDVNLKRKGLTELPSLIQFGTVKGDFICLSNHLTSLKGVPRAVIGRFDCSFNDLTSLEGAPKEVGGSFYCNNNKLTSLKNAPKWVGKNFYCDFNTLKTLKGAPEKIGGFFDCSDNKLKTLEGSPKEVGRDFYCNNNTTQFTEEDVLKVCKVKKDIYV